MLIAQKLEELARAHDDLRRAVCLYLMEHAQDAAELTLRGVSEATAASKPSVVRIVQQLGFSGWRAFQAAYAREVASREMAGADVDCNIPFTREASVSQIAQALARVRAASTYQTLQMLDIAALERAVSYVATAGRIVLFGYGFNAPALDSFARKLLQIGIAAYVPAQDNYAHATKMLAAGDCLVVASYSGAERASNMLRFLPEVRARGVRVVGITSEGDTYLRAHADAVLTMCSDERLYAKIGTFSTEASVAYLFDVLYGCLFARAYERNLAYKTGNAHATEENRRG